MFLDQTEETVAKHTQSAGPSRRPSRTTSAVRAASTGREHERQPERDDAPDLLIRPEFTRLDMDDFAVQYCFQHNILYPRKGADTTKSTIDPALLACFKAIGMATHSANEHSPESAVQARKFYHAAIQTTSAALQSPSACTQDSTFMAVVALSYFECILGDDSHSMAAWSQHVDGTAALIAMRGRDSFKKPEGFILFMQACVNIMHKSFRMGRRVPQQILEAMSEATKLVKETTDPLWISHCTMLELTDLYSDVINWRLQDPEKTIAEALRLERQLASAFDDAIPAWEFQIQQVEKTDESIYPGYVHNYQNALSAQVWNSIRNGRIFCHLIVLGTLRRLYSLTIPFEGSEELRAKSVSVITEMSNDILASIPQHVGFPKFEGRGSERLPVPSSRVTKVMDFEASSLPVLRTTTGYHLVWAINLVGGAASAGSSMRSSAIRALRLVGSSLAIKQALFLAQDLEDTPVPSVG